MLILSGAHQESVARELADLSVDFHPTTCAGARMHTPVETTESALEIVTSLRIDGLVAIGGGFGDRFVQGTRGENGSSAGRVTDDIRGLRSH